MSQPSPVLSAEQTIGTTFRVLLRSWLILGLIHGLRVGFCLFI